ncbi:MAG: alpha/beta hydrolase [Micromonosporaceae bacterium]|nr:alpha/beta hydrolase [Micromonosporaceae bacterium]
MTRSTVIIPGRLFGPCQPLLFYAGKAVLARGGAVEPIDWNAAESLDPSASSAARHAWVRDQVAPVLDRLGGRPVLIGKSLGSYAADLAAQRGLPAIWYTPLLLDELVVASLRASTAPFLLIGGTADTGAWDGSLARSLTPYVCEIPDADHMLTVPAGLTASATVLGEVTAAAERFLDEVVWPA